MTKTPVLLVAATLGLAACSGGSDFIPISLPQSNGGAAVESNVELLNAGMTMQDVGKIIGMPIAHYDDPAMPGRVCFSHPYGSGSQRLYVHTIFVGGNLKTATSGHDAVCGPADI